MPRSWHSDFGCCAVSRRLVEPFTFSARLAQGAVKASRGLLIIVAPWLLRMARRMQQIGFLQERQIEHVLDLLLVFREIAGSARLGILNLVAAFYERDDVAVVKHLFRPLIKA